MSELWICREQTATNPLRLKTTGVEIRTIEELCFYLYQNIERLDEDVMDESLFVWLSEELQLAKTASLLRQEQERGRDVLWLAWLLLKEAGMYSDSELEEIRSVCLAMENKDEFECRKLKADRLLVNKKYIRSIREYQELLQGDERTEKHWELTGAIWHNLGAAHAGLFLFPEAAEYFLKAYKRTRRTESLQAYEAALQMNDDPYISRRSEADEDQNVDWEERLELLKEEYRKNVM